MINKLLEMKKLLNIFNPKAFIGFVLVLNGLQVIAQDKVAPSAAPASSFTLDVNTLLIVVIFLLLLIIASLGYTLSASVGLYKKRKKANSADTLKTILIALLCMGGLQAFGQEATEGAAAVQNTYFTDDKILRYLLYTVVVLELIVIFAFVYWIRFFTGITDLEEEKAKEAKKLFKGMPGWWARANRLKPMEEEDALDVGHSYDGIRELDNATPPWFTISFIATIVFGMGYFWRYQVAHAAPTQFEELEIAQNKASLEHEAYLKTKGDAVNENTVKMLEADGIAAGKTLYQNNCTACHGKVGEGSVGPNLTDDYWLHGGSIGSVFKSIKLGIPDKGMMSWKDVFSPDQIAELSSYIKSLHNTNPPNAKEKQGDVYKEEAAGAPASTADSTANAAPQKTKGASELKK